jgi:hypothetical protein
MADRVAYMLVILVETERPRHDLGEPQETYVPCLIFQLGFLLLLAFADLYRTDLPCILVDHAGC